jgi:hypothetical protein
MDDDRSKRKKLLRKLLLQIMQGNYNSNKQTSNELFPDSGNAARKEYVSPADRQSNNYGYTTHDDIDLDGQEQPHNW